MSSDRVELTATLPLLYPHPGTKAVAAAAAAAAAEYYAGPLNFDRGSTPRGGL
jgi:hypothetical protein